MQGEIDVLVQRLDERRRELDKEEKIRRNQESDLRQIPLHIQGTRLLEYEVVEPHR